MGRKINDYPLDTAVSDGDKLIGSDEQGNTKNFTAGAIVDSTLNNLTENIADGWVLGASDDRVTEAFLRTDAEEINSVAVFTATRTSVNADSSFLSALSIGDRVVIVNQRLRFLTTVAGIATTSFALVDEISQIDLDIFNGVTAGYSASDTKVTGYLNPVTTFQGNIIAPGVSGVTPEQAAEIVANTAKVGITTTQAAEITANTAKDGITEAQATAITTNTSDIATNVLDIADNTAKTGITTEQAGAITTNTAKTGISTAQANAITANTSKTGISTSQSNAIINNATNIATNTTGLTNVQQFAKDTTTIIPANKLPNIQYGEVLEYDTLDLLQAGSDTWNVGDVWAEGTTNTHLFIGTSGTLSAAVVQADFRLISSGSSTVSSIMAGANINVSGNTGVVTVSTDAEQNVKSDWNQTTTNADSYIENKPTTITTAQANAITANTSKTGISTAQSSAITANTAKTGITTAQTSAITANTSKVSVSGLNQVGGAIIATDSVLYYDNTTPRRKTFSSVPLSVFNNDAGFTTSNLTVNGTANEITVNTVGDTATISIDSAITDDIDANTNKTGITGAQTNAITANTAKTGISTAQASAITANTAKVDVNALNQVGADVLSTDSVVYLAGGPEAPRKKVFSSIPLSIFNNDAGFVTTAGASLTADQIFTGTNTFSNSVLLSSNLVHAGDTNTLLSFTNDDITLVAGGSRMLSLQEGTLDGDRVVVNDSAGSVDFIVKKQTAGEAINYDAGTDTLTFDAATINGVVSTASDNTFTGRNTFTDTVIFSDISTTDGSIQIDRIIGINSDTYVDLGSELFDTAVISGDVVVVRGASHVGLQHSVSDQPLVAVPGSIVLNNSRLDKDFSLRKETSGDAIAYDSGLDTLDIGSPTTFSETAVFSNATTAIQADVITGVTNTASSIDFTPVVLGNRSLTIQTPGALQLDTDFSTSFGFSDHSAMSISESITLINTHYRDRDFELRKNTSGTAIRYDAGTDTLSSNAANFEGFADQESGTWTPSWIRVGTLGTVTATYHRVGKTVVLTCEAVVAASTDTGSALITLGSLPFSFSGGFGQVALGTYYNAISSGGSGTVDSGVVASTSNTMGFQNDTNKTSLKGTDLRGYLGFTVTYETDD